MATTTPSLGLRQPDPADYVDVTTDISNNMALIDTAVASKASTADITSAVTVHESGTDPHPNYATDSDLSTHVGATDPHTGYVLESLLTTKGDLFAASAASTPARLAAGTNGQFLTAQSAQTVGLQWASHDASGDPHAQYLLESTVTTKGDILAATGSSGIVRLGVGTDLQVLIADSSQTSGLRWGTTATGYATRVFSRANFR